MATGPTLTGYLAFLRDVAGIPVPALPDNAPVIPISLSVSLGIVNMQLQCVGYVPTAILAQAGLPTNGPTIYDLACYNLATDRLINFAPDQSGSTFFADLRSSFSINTFVAGVIASTFDQGTGQTMVVPDAMKGLTLSDLQRLKTPYGRQYLEFAQAAGDLWGIT